MKTRFIFVAALLALAAVSAQADPAVRITSRANGLIRGTYPLGVTVSPEVVRTELSINGVRSGERTTRSMVFPIQVGHYLRPLRVHVAGYDASGALLGEDVMVINDPRPPFRVKLIARDPDANGFGDMNAVVTAPDRMRVSEVEFYYGETMVARDVDAPFSAKYSTAALPQSSYARVVARAATGEEANDVFFFGTTPREAIDVILQRLPVSVVGKEGTPLVASDLRLIENGEEKPIEGVLRAVDQPMSVVLLLDSSESMLEELPVLKEAARGFARRLIQDNSSVAIVGFAQGTFWLTPFTRDVAAIDRAVEQLRPRGQTHLYDSVIEMLFELQKRDGRRALVVLSDGANQGGDFTLDHVTHYARYSGVPVYPVIKNTMLAKLRRFGVARLQERKLSNLAKETGATYFIIEKPQQLGGVYQQIANELRNQYLVLFYPKESQRDRWHSLKLVSASGLKLRAPSGFFP